MSSLAASIELPVFEDQPPDDNTSQDDLSMADCDKEKEDEERLCDASSSPEQETVLPKHQTSSRGPHVQQLFNAEPLKSETMDSLATVSTGVQSPSQLDPPKDKEE